MAKGWKGERRRHSIAARKHKSTKFDFPKKRSENRYHLTVFVPSTKGRDKPITEEKFRKRIDKTRDILNKKMGGTTKVTGEGSFKLKSGRTIKEPVAKVETYAKRRNYLRYDQDVKKFLKKKKKQWKQESIGVTFESPERPSEEMHFV